ncbi:NTP transferase domain-containing protein [Natrialbaceae archaeon GCM10025810]|uniref:NTP transferase domain-containing protein n=1 Tax=Halovalidus salilacus TaxID=3075124 RepID=UPI00361A4507
MCGGKGTRLESDREKPLHPVGGVPMVDSVLRALEGSRIETIYAAVSPNAPETRIHLERADSVTTVETPGEGYVADLVTVLESEDGASPSRPVLTVAADLPLLEAPVVDRVLDLHEHGRGGPGNQNRAASRTICVPATLKRRLGASVDSRLESEAHLAPTGVNVVGDADDTMTNVSYDPRLAVNVNRLEDARLAAELRATIRGGDENEDGDADAEVTDECA